MVLYYCKHNYGFYTVGNENPCPICEKKVNSEVEKFDTSSLNVLKKEQKITRISMIPMVDSFSNIDSNNTDEITFRTNYLKKSSFVILIKNFFAVLGIITGIMAFWAFIELVAIPGLDTGIQQSTILRIIRFALAVVLGGGLVTGVILLIRSIIEFFYVPFKFVASDNPEKLITRFISECFNERWAIIFSNYPLAFFLTTKSVKLDFKSYQSFKIFWKNIKPKIKNLIRLNNPTDQDDNFKFTIDNFRSFDNENDTNNKSFIISILIKTSKDESIPLVPLEIKGNIRSINNLWYIDSSFYYLILE